VGHPVELAGVIVADEEAAGERPPRKGDGVSGEQSRGKPGTSHDPAMIRVRRVDLNAA
jgi:hypothetical protein